MENFKNLDNYYDNLPNEDNELNECKLYYFNNFDLNIEIHVVQVLTKNQY